MIDYRFDDGGRAAAGYRGKTGDCVVRAIAICAREDYRAVYATMAEHMKLNGYAASGKAYATRESNRILKAYGFRKVRLPAGERPTYTEAHHRYGDCIAGTTKHVAAIVGGALRDTFDGRTYEWATESGVETRERKAQSVWVRRRATERVSKKGETT